MHLIGSGGSEALSNNETAKRMVGQRCFAKSVLVVKI